MLWELRTRCKNFTYIFHVRIKDKALQYKNMGCLTKREHCTCQFHAQEIQMKKYIFVIFSRYSVKNMTSLIAEYQRLNSVPSSLKTDFCRKPASLPNLNEPFLLNLLSLLLKLLHFALLPSGTRMIKINKLVSLLSSDKGIFITEV